VNVKTPLRIEDAVRQDANDAIDRFAGRGSCELLADYASEIPLKAICRIVGFDVEKGPELQRLTDDLVINLGNPEAAASASKALADACVEEIEDRRKNPRDDFLTQLLHAEMWGRPITQDEIGHSVASLVAAGHQTAVSGLVNLLYEVLSRPSIKQRLIDDPKLIPAAVEESLRLNPVSMGFYRRATKPTTIRDVKINKDEQVMMCWATANRDPKRYNDPDSFELDRVRKRHLTFGLGLHVCIGAPVARMELRIAVEELLRRLPDIEFADPDAIERVFGGIEFVMIPALPAKFTPVAV
jgi:cytochrome P450